VNITVLESDQNVTWTQEHWNTNRLLHKNQLQWYWTVQGVNPSRGMGFFFSSLKHPDQLCSPPSLLFNAYYGSFQMVKRLGREVNCSPAPVPKWRMSGAILLLPLYVFMVWTGKASFFSLQWYEVITIHVCMQMCLNSGLGSILPNSNCMKNEVEMLIGWAPDLAAESPTSQNMVKF
jgi:hypothetical protein